MELPRSRIYLINALLVAGGIILLLSAGYITSANLTIVRTILEALGTSAIVTAAINFLDRSLTEKPDGVAIVAKTRSKVPPSIHENLFKSDHIDILGLSMTTCLRQLATDRKADFAKNVLLNNDCRMHILFVHPCSPYLNQREVEDNIDEPGQLLRNQLESVEYCAQIYENLNKELNHLRDMGEIYQPVGRLEIKMINACPYITIERYDDKLFWGLYPADTEGVNSHMFAAHKKHNSELHEQLKNHFEGLMNHNFPIPGTPSNTTLLTVTLNGVWINKELVNFLIPGRLPVP